ncbi:MAG TPA: TIGR03617 family F420-dependent LLM class oxidoreductase [Candidatus Limnocylindrales bacterium]|nr:TIGR03617 family F420-dependent LLM class oxidoreductase [Candidatus Limnocylindrales bacterium]
MKLDAFGFGLELHAAGDRARQWADVGFDGIQMAEGGRTAYLNCVASILAAPELDIGTAIATAFPRSPMVTAQIAWELAEASRGKFTLGLGTQVKAHIERRFSSVYDHPGSRLREYVRAVRAIFRAFQGTERLDFRGEFYNMNLLGMWSPGAIEHPEVPIYVAAVRPWMLQAAGEVADGIHIHPFHSTKFLDEIVRPNVEKGARKAGRDPKSIKLACPVFTIVGDSDEERETSRERTRMQIAFYGSTPAYAGVFELHGWHGISERLHQLQREGDMSAMAATVTDRMLEEYAVTSTWDDLPATLSRKYAGVAERLIFYFADFAIDGDDRARMRWKRALAETRERARADRA